MKATQPPRRSALPAIIGIDPSLNGTGICVRTLDGDYLHQRLEPPKGCVGVPRLAWLRERLTDVLTRAACSVRLAVVEGYSYGSTSHAHALGEWGGVLRLVLADAGVTDLITIPPQTLKKWVIGHAKPGQCGKDVMILKTFQTWGKAFHNGDECDAFCLTKAGEALWKGDRVDGLTKAEREKISLAN